MKFTELKYARPDTAALLAAYKALAEKAKAAQSGEEVLAVWAEHVKLDTDYGFMARLASIRYTIDTRDEFYAAERDFLTRPLPPWATPSLRSTAPCSKAPTARP